jgi:ABC-2 type transport system ATP-binding protein
MIQIVDLNFRFKEKTVLDNINLTFYRGNCYGLLGANGSGKSTLLNCLANVLQPGSGEIIINDLYYKKNEVAIKKLMGFVLDTNPLIEDFSGWQYMNFVGIMHKLNANQLKERITTIVNFFFDDPDVLAKSIHTFSTGMKKKLSVCASVIHQPDYLILDEPFSGLDIVAAKKLVDFIKFYAAENRVVLITSHDLHFINQIADEVIVIHENRIIFNDKLNTFLSNGKHQIDEALYTHLVPEEREYNWESIQWLK